MWFGVSKTVYLAPVPRPFLSPLWRFTVWAVRWFVILCPLDFVARYIL